MVSEYLAALMMDISRVLTEYPAPVETIYFGGGSPGVLKAKEISLIISKIMSLCPEGGSRLLEVTVELNPKDAKLDYLNELARGGVNRISLGVQSFDSETLKLLGRMDDVHDVMNAVSNIKESNIDNYSLDLIYGIPRYADGVLKNTKAYSIDTLKADLVEMIKLRPPHISTYCLSIEEKTKLDLELKAGKIIMPSEDEVADQLDLLIDLLVSAGYKRYEISNFALNDSEAQHNSKYWEYANTLGIGSGAVYTYGGKRVENVRNVKNYIEKVCADKFPYGEVSVLSEEEQVFEFLIMGFRLERGIDTIDLFSRFGVDFELAYSAWIKKYMNFGFLKKTERGYALTDRGMNLSNSLLSDLYVEDLKGVE